MTAWGECGTPGCALGHYAARRDLQRTFTLQTEGEMVDVCTANGEWVAFPLEDSVLEVFEEHFDLSASEVERLFGPDGCGRAKTPNKAADYIERFVKQRAKKELSTSS